MQANQEILFILALSGLVIAVFSLVLGIIANLTVRKIKKNIQEMFSGKNVQDLESLIIEHSAELKALDKEIQDLFEISNKIHNLASNSIHKVDVLRFNPFKDIGGDQSFAISLLNGKNSGIVLSSLHTREGTRVYAKPIIKGTSERYTLTEEEKRSLKNATSIKSSKS